MTGEVLLCGCVAQPDRSSYVYKYATCNDWEELNQKQYIIKCMTCGMGFHLLLYYKVKCGAMYMMYGPVNYLHGNKVITL